MSVNVSLYKVYRRESGIAKMSTGLGPSYREWEEPAVSARIVRRWDGVPVSDSIPLNCTLFCLPGGSVQGLDATDEQIIEAVIGDEHIY